MSGVARRMTVDAAQHRSGAGSGGGGGGVRRLDAGLCRSLPAAAGRGRRLPHLSLQRRRWPPRRRRSRCSTALRVGSRKPPRWRSLTGATSIRVHHESESRTR
eukprot:scaffold3968_cov359-Prasinococcus_capsulatus_cf.AAC.5